MEVFLPAQAQKLKLDSGHIGGSLAQEGVWPERIAIGLTVSIRHENVVRLLEFLGYRLSE